MDAQFLTNQRDELRVQLAALRAARDQLATAAMGAADEMARTERMVPGSVADERLARSRRAQDHLAQLDEQIKSIVDTLKTVEDRLARAHETGSP